MTTARKGSEATRKGKWYPQLLRGRDGPRRAGFFNGAGAELHQRPSSIKVRVGSPALQGQEAGPS
jgi:hypothetical protein